MDTNALRAPFPPDRISWRVGSTKADKTAGLALAYIDARDVMDRLDAVCGPANWSDRYEFHGVRTVCYLSIRIGDEWVTKADGAGDSDVEAEKGSISDALKRAAVKWGIGRYLYELPKVWVDLKPVGNSFAIKEGQEAKLERALKGAATEADRREPAAPKSISERASEKIHEPADRQDDLDERILVVTLAAMRLAKTTAEFDAWRQKPENKATFNDLSKKSQDTVLLEGRKLREALAQAEALAA